MATLPVEEGSDVQYSLVPAPQAQAAETAPAVQAAEAAPAAQAAGAAPSAQAAEAAPAVQVAESAAPQPKPPKQCAAQASEAAPAAQAADAAPAAQTDGAAPAESPAAEADTPHPMALPKIPEVPGTSNEPAPKPTEAAAAAQDTASGAQVTVLSGKQLQKFCALGRAIAWAKTRLSTRWIMVNLWHRECTPP
jgi:hypothetical protein